MNECQWLGCCLFLFLGAVIAKAESTSFQAGFSKVDITPTEPVRMAGYGSRDHASEGIATPLFVRCMAIQDSNQATPSLLFSIDTIGLPGSFSRELAEQIKKSHRIPREQIAFCSTHTHAGPDLVSELSNIFAKPLSDAEIAAGQRYREQLRRGILASVQLAIDKLAPVKLDYGVGEAKFAANRRVLKEGRWVNFGVQSDGPVDHTVPVLRISTLEGQILGLVFNYACHCTTLTGQDYLINADWAGYAATHLEAQWEGSIAMCTIGCGADANPEPRGNDDFAKLHGRSLAEEIMRIVSAEMRPLNQPIEHRFEYEALSFDLPTEEELTSRLEHGDVQTKRHAKQLLKTLEEHGRLPATYPVPIQAWKFGDQLTMVFLGGEVVVDYALRLYRELPIATLGQNNKESEPAIWVTAYANDVLGYIASERMRTEGGYEYDRSGVFYGLPGPWATGTEDRLIQGVKDLVTGQGRAQPLAPDDAIGTLRVSDGYDLQLVAAEPLVQDPINLAFDQEGRLWVVEMGDYPEGESGGRVKTLTDEDGDGVFDTSTVFLSGLSFPTGVFPWREGVLISVAPDVLFAQDTDGDGTADQVSKLYTGFRLANPQHRINGFSYGLDHSLHLASGDNLGEITSTRSGQTVNASGHDVQIWPDDGQIAVTCGRTQFIRSRNDWGQWFGNDNSKPMYHFPIAERYLRRNPHVAIRDHQIQLFEPPIAPPVFPIAKATGRFNDLFAANRFTSACSTIVARTPRFATSSDCDTVFVCEPVHRLVHRAELRNVSVSYQATRSDSEQASEFLASTDPWFRPVRALIGPDDALYVVDMYRETIEHPEWIPRAWQMQLDLYAGSDRGRIYRIVSKSHGKRTLPNLKQLSTQELTHCLRSSCGALRDLAQQAIIEQADKSGLTDLKDLAADSSHPHGQVHALASLDVLGELDRTTLQNALKTEHFGVLLVGIRLAERHLNQHPELLDSFNQLTTHSDARVRMALALALGETDHPQASAMLLAIAKDNHEPWIERAILTSAKPHASVLLQGLLSESQQHPVSIELISGLLATSAANGDDVLSDYASHLQQIDHPLEQRLQLASCLALACKESEQRSLLKPIYTEAVSVIASDQQAIGLRHAAMQLVGLGIGTKAKETQMLLELVAPNVPTPVQLDAIERLGQFSDPELGNAMLSHWPSMSQAIRDRCLSVILRRRSWTQQLLTALESRSIPLSDLGIARQQQLSMTGSRSMRVRAERLFRNNQRPSKADLVNRYAQALTATRDPARGATLFQQHCAVCHVGQAESEPVGASLSNLTDRSDAGLLTAILDPNQAVDPKYQTYGVITFDASILVGAIESESGTSLTIAHADGTRTTLRRSEIAELKNTGVSLMPTGFETTLPPLDLQDILAYLQQMPAG